MKLEKLTKLLFSIILPVLFTEIIILFITAFNNFLDNYGSVWEDALFYKFDSAYKLAINSVKWKQQERTEKALKFYKSLLRYFPETKYLSQVNLMHEELNNLKNNKTPKS